MSTGAKVLVAILFLLGTGCGTNPAPEADTGIDAAIDAAASDVGAPDAATDSPAFDAIDVRDVPTPAPVVSHDREMRGLWITTVYNINWPVRASDTEAKQKADLIEIFDAAEAAGLNAIFLQVRSEGDALYRSDLEPFSRFLTGSQGGDPGYDPLAFATAEAHARNLELHAWMNPYRVRSDARFDAAESHISRARPELTVDYGNLTWLDPGNPAARDHTLSVVRDVLERYDVDGIHFDDYFYPYPEAGVEFQDGETFAAYEASGGGLGRSDWRRDNVNRMVEAVNALVLEARPDVRFGIAPFGIYRPGMPAGVRGLDQFEALFADPITWIREGWLDYIAPQLYWTSTSSGQPFEELINWWAERGAEFGADVYAGHALYQIRPPASWPVSEIEEQVRLTRAARARGAFGSIFYHSNAIRMDSGGVASRLTSEFYAVPATTTELERGDEVPDAPVVEADGGFAVLEPVLGGRSFLFYQEEAGEFALAVRRPASDVRVPLSRGQWAVTVVNRFGKESLPARLSIDEDPPPPTGRDCLHSFGGSYGDMACSASFQCCDGTWGSLNACGDCTCTEPTGETGCR